MEKEEAKVDTKQAENNPWDYALPWCNDPECGLQFLNDPPESHCRMCGTRRLTRSDIRGLFEMMNRYLQD